MTTENCVAPGLRLGALPVRQDPRTFRLARYLADVPAPPPDAVDWLAGPASSWDVYANDRLGNCTCVTAANLVRDWTRNDGAMQAVTLDDVVAAYSAVSGYDPRTGRNDRGAVVLDLLNHWRKTGVGGHRIDAYVKVNVRNPTEVKRAIHIFGGLYVGADLPWTANTQLRQGRPWTVVGGRGQANAPRSWGGHAFAIGAYDARQLTGVTWGRKQTLTWGWLEKYVAEAYAVLPTSDWTGPDDRTPHGFNMERLRADLQAL